MAEEIVARKQWSSLNAEMNVVTVDPKITRFREGEKEREREEREGKDDLGHERIGVKTVRRERVGARKRARGAPAD